MEQVKCEVDHASVLSILKCRLQIRKTAPSEFVEDHNLAVQDRTRNSQPIRRVCKREHPSRPIQPFPSKQTSFCALAFALHMHLNTVSIELEFMNPISSVRR